MIENIALKTLEVYEQMANDTSTADMLNAAIRSNSAVPVDAYNRPISPAERAANTPKVIPGNNPKTFQPVQAQYTKRGKR